MEWCDSTPAISIFIYCAAEVLCLGVSLPMVSFLGVLMLIFLIKTHFFADGSKP
jgi:hypothetical protein